MKSSRTPKLLAIAAAVAVVVTAYELGLFRQFGDLARAKQTLVDLGPWGYLAFVVAYAVLQPFGVPGTVFIMVAPLVWPWPIAFALSMTGTMAASVVGFSFARFVARDWVSERIPERFRRYEDALAKRGFVTVVVLRFVLWMPPLLHAFFGVSKVGFWTHFWGSVVGYAIPLFLVSFFGEKIFDILKNLPLSAWIGTGAALIVVALVVWMVRRRSRRA